MSSMSSMSSMTSRVRMLVALAARDLARQRRRAATAVAILVFGACAVLLTRGWQRGMLEQLSREGAAVWLGAVQLQPATSAERRDAFALEPNIVVDDALRRHIRERAPQVTHVSPRIRFLARLAKLSDAAAAVEGDRSAGAQAAQDEGAPCFVLASDMETAPALLPRLFTAERLESGRLPQAGRADEVLVAAPLAAALGLSAGDTATILARPVDGGLEGADVRVVGIVRAAFEENQRRALIMDLTLARRILRMDDRATEVLLGVEPLSDAAAVARALNGGVAAARGELVARTWEEINPRYVAARKIWATSLGVMLIVVVLVAALGISTSLHLIVRERARDVATLTALGLTRASLLAMFLVEGVLLGIVGGACGASLGAAIVAALGARGVSFLPPGGFTVVVRPHLSFSDIGAALVAGALLSALVMMFPAWRAARRNPAEMLR